MHYRREINKLGFSPYRGAYRNTTDDRIDGWYLDPKDGRTIDRRGAGFRTLREAYEALRDHLS